eukprot:scaffold1116_cov103-Isochrysis_galbana.AAC.9
MNISAPLPLASKALGPTPCAPAPCPRAFIHILHHRDHRIMLMHHYHYLPLLLLSFLVSISMWDLGAPVTCKTPGPPAPGST